MSAEKKVGLMVLAAFLCVLVTVMFVGRVRLGFYSSQIKVAFNFVDSLKRDAPVLYGGGVRIGVVDKLEVADGHVLVTCLLKGGVRIPKDSSVTINTTGILGEKYVQVSAGNPESGFLGPGEMVTGRDPGSLDRALQRVEKLSDFLSTVFSDDELKDSVVTTLRNSGQLAKELSELVHGSKDDVKTTLANLKSASENLNSSSQDAKAMVASAKGMLSEKNRQNMEKSLELLRADLERLDKALKKMDDKTSVLGVLAEDETVGEDLRNLITDLKNHPWKLLWKK
jgi:phospholipid/cholesterol/gamma-HCH transport system substrate-binding protein